MTTTTAAKGRERRGGVTKPCTCAAKKKPGCVHSYRLEFMHKGTRHRVSLDDVARKHLGLRAARELAETLKAQIRAGTWPPPAPVAAPPVAALTVDEATPRFLAHTATPHARRHRKGEGGRKIDEAGDRSRAFMVGAHWVDGRRFGALPVDALRAHHVEAIVQDYRVQGRPASTTNKVMLFLRSLCRWLHAKGYVAQPILAADSEVMRRDTEAKRTRRLAPEERARLLAACKPWLRALVEAAIETGCRRGELLGLTWAMVDLDKRMITLPAALTKTSQSRAVPITTRLEALLRMRRHDPAGEAHKPTAHVFGDELGRPVKSIKTCWRTAVRKAGLLDLRFHDLRREAASTLLERGLPLHHVSKLLGHANIATTHLPVGVQRGPAEGLRRAGAARARGGGAAGAAGRPSGAPGPRVDDRGRRPGHRQLSAGATMAITVPGVVWQLFTLTTGERVPLQVEGDDEREVWGLELDPLGWPRERRWEIEKATIVRRQRLVVDERTGLIVLADDPAGPIA